MEYFTLDEKYILRYAVEDLIDKKKTGEYTIQDIKTVWEKILKLIDNHDKILTPA
jgi:hypothetical protein